MSQRVTVQHRAAELLQNFLRPTAAPAILSHQVRNPTRTLLALIFSLTFPLLGPNHLAAQTASTYQLSSPPPISGFLSKTAIDIISHNGAIWLATGQGVNYTTDSGQSWHYFNTTNGLISNNVSAISSLGGRLFLGSNHDEFVIDQLVSASDGISYTDNNGLNWQTIDFNSSGQNIPFVTGGNRTIFDIVAAENELESAHNDWVVFSAFAGGLLASRDGGNNWRRLYATSSDSLQFNSGGPPSLRNRAFSAVVDTSHGDSLILYSGTAGGVFQYVYAPQRDKLFAHRFVNSAPCTDCPDSTKVFHSARGSVVTGTKSGGPFFTRAGVSEGLPAGSGSSALITFGDNLIVGTVDSLNGNATGMYRSTDAGNSFSPVTSGPPSGAGNAVLGFQQFRQRLYLAAGSAGLWVSNDTGGTWFRIYLDSSVTTSAVNRVNDLDTADDRFYVGSDSGMFAVYVGSGGAFDSSYAFVFPENDSSSTRVIRLETQPTLVVDTFLLIDTSIAPPDTTTIIDTLNPLWSINLPLTGAGQPIVSQSVSGGRSWVTRVEGRYFDVGFTDTLAFLTEIGGMKRTTFRPTAPLVSLTIADSLNSSVNLNADTIFSAVGFGDTLILGGNSGLAYSTSRGSKFKIHRANVDSLNADAVVNYTIASTLFRIPGDFIPALAVQYHPDTLAHVWLSGRPVDLGGDGISRGTYRIDTVAFVDTLGDTTYLIDSSPRLKWQIIYEDGFAWNYAFDGDTVFAATNAGLLRYVDTRTGNKWDTVSYATDGNGRPLLEAGTAVYAVHVAGSYLWAGTNDGFLKIDLTNPSLTSQQLISPIDSTTPADQVYAFPVPFSPGRGGSVDFHFVVDQSGPVTIEIYDFAMNLVARPVDAVAYAAGIYPDGASQGRTWDGRNGKGDIVAVGVYYFRVLRPGTSRWGKIAVMP